LPFESQVNCHLGVLVLEMDRVAVENAETSALAASAFDHLSGFGVGERGVRLVAFGESFFQRGDEVGLAGFEAAPN